MKSLINTLLSGDESLTVVSLFPYTNTYKYIYLVNKIMPNNSKLVLYIGKDQLMIIA